MSDLPEDETLETAADSGDGGPKISASDEMEAALAEATASFDQREAEENAASAADSDAASPDKMTIELLSQELQDLKTLHEEKLKEIEGVCNPIVSKVYQQGGDDDADSYGDDDDDDDHDEL